MTQKPLDTPPENRVSVVLPTYNRGWILKHAVDSVLDQDYGNLELVVVDDGSTDETPQLLSAFGDRLHIIRQENQGVSAARNAGIRASTGELIALLDSDDAWLPGKVTAQVAFFTANPDALICQTEETWIRNGVRVNPGKRHRKEAGMIFERSLALCLVSPSAVMMRRSLLDEVGLFDESLPACEDYDLWLRVAWKHPIHLIDRPLIVKRGGHEDQLSRMPELDKYRIQSITRLLGSNVLSFEQREAAITMLKNKCTIYAQGCRKRGRMEEAAHFEQLGERYEKGSRGRGFKNSSG
ncbi:glycosyltransferase family A protein [uncultured Desulfosarcina sp.]|uniref:glycosyltransferase family 2 protein n=1 Tax=uncultured Desulfosarcina sp. TaxID=218289 RepID=UPI0029C647EC|nr:glycosyltransferase family A protein [uncultured Desulfosarcina sp.]